MINGRFQPVKVYDKADVVDANGQPPVAPSRGSDGHDLRTHTDDEDNDELNALFDAVMKSIEHLGLKVVFVGADDLGGARGWSKGGTIGLLNTATGPSKVKTAIHELGHELMHQDYLKTKAQGGDFSDPKMRKSIMQAYIGRDSKEVLELQAESVAYVVLRAFDINWKHSVNYIALWKGTADAIRTNLQIITNTSNKIIKLMNSFIENTTPVYHGGEDGEEVVNETDDVTNDTQGHLVTPAEVAQLLNLDMSQLHGGGINEAVQHILSRKNMLKGIL